jgi:spermidine synthase
MAEEPQRVKQDWLLLVGLLFLFLWAAGLIYQVVWTRMLTQIFGNTTYAIATVLTAFMAGLHRQLSVRQAADRGKTISSHGILEAGVGVYFLVPCCLPARKTYVPIFELNQSHPFV